MILYISDLEDSISNFFQNYVAFQKKCWGIQNQIAKISSFSIHQQQTYREGDHGHTPIPNSHKESKISRDKPIQGSGSLYNEDL